MKLSAIIAVLLCTFVCTFALTIDQTVKVDPELTSLNANITTALATVLNGTGPFTLFAPNNAAFAAFNNGTGAYPTSKADLYGYHVVDADIGLQTQNYTTRFAPNEVYVRNYSAPFKNTTLVNAFEVVNSTIPVSNGKLYVIDGVLYPVFTNFTILFDRLTDYSMFRDLFFNNVSQSVRDDILSTGQTIFAPNNAALNAFINKFTVANFNALTQTQIDDLIKYHVLSMQAPVFSRVLLQGNLVVATKYTDTLTVITGTGVQVNSTKGETATVIAPDITTNVGVIHGINQVLVPGFVNFPTPNPSVTPGPTSTPTPAPSSASQVFVSVALLIASIIAALF